MGDFCHALAGRLTPTATSGALFAAFLGSPLLLDISRFFGVVLLCWRLFA
jgi:hypothetical protein